MSPCDMLLHSVRGFPAEPRRGRRLDLLVGLAFAVPLALAIWAVAVGLTWWLLG